MRTGGAGGRHPLRVLLLCVALLPFPVAMTATPAAAAGGAIYVPNVTKTLGGPGGWTTPVALQNIGAASSAATLGLYRFADGVLVATIPSPELGPGQAWVFDPLAYPSLPHDTQFSLLVQPRIGEFSAVVLEGSGSSWMAYSGKQQGGPKVYLPNVTRRLGGPDGWETPFIVQNLGGARVTASISFYRFADGGLAHRIENVALDPGRSRAFIPAAIAGLQDDRQYSVVVEGPAASQLYAVVNEHQRAEAMSYEGILAGAPVVYLPNVTKFLGGTDRWSTPFVVQNVGATAATFMIEFYGFATGALATKLGPVTLQPGRSHAVDVRFAPVPAGQYSVVVRGPAGAQLGAIVNQMEMSAGMSMAYNGIGAAQPSAYLPHVQKNNGGPLWSSPVIAQNLGTAASDITITLFSSAGAVAAQRTYRGVAPGAAAVYDVRFDRCLPNGAYSALVQAATAVAAVVNHSGTTAGDVAMAYASTPAPATPRPSAPPPLPRVVGGIAFGLTCTSTADVYAEVTLTSAASQTVLASVDGDVAQIEQDFGRRFTARATVYTFATTASYVRARTTIFEITDPDTTAPAFYWSGNRSIALDWQALADAGLPFTTLRHELAHQMVDQITDAANFFAVPAWLNEGSARLEEFTASGSAWLATRGRYRAASMAATNTLLSLEDMRSQATWNRRPEPARSHQYDAAGQAVALLRGEIGQPGVVRILDLLALGHGFEQAYATVSGRSFDAFALAYPTRVRALAERYPGVATAQDTPDGPGLFIFMYGFVPNDFIRLEISGGGQQTTNRLSDDIGTAATYLFDSWPPGQYTITATGANGAMTVTATKPLSFVP